MIMMKVLFDIGLPLQISLPVFHDCLQADFPVDSVELELEIIFSGLILCDLEYCGSHSACCYYDCSDRQVHFLSSCLIVARDMWSMSNIFDFFLRRGRIDLWHRSVR